MNKNVRNYNYFIEKNPDFDLMSFDHPDAEWNHFQTAGVDRSGLSKYIDRLQAIHNLHDDIEVKHAILERGYTSSTAIYQTAKEDFIDQLDSVVGAEEAEKIYQKAFHNYHMAVNFVTSVKSTYGSDYYKAIKTLSNVSSEETEKQLENIPNYQEIFGSLDYCKCEECKSIFGPAAYFVDLLRIITSKKYITYTKDNRAILFSERRKDLIDELELTCENTNQLVPYIKIVNRILEKYSKEEIKKDDIFQELEKIYYPMQLPFQLTQQQIKAVAEFCKGVKLADLRDAWCQEEEIIVKEYLGISTELLNVLSSNINASDLPQYYGLEKIDLTEIGKLSNFMEASELDMNELYDLFLQTLEEDELSTAHTFFINQGLPDGKYLMVKDVIQADQSKLSYIEYLDEGALDRIYRFRKLSKTLGLSFEQMDWLLKISNNGAAGINKKIIIEAGKILRFIDHYQLDFFSVTSLIGDLKSYGKNKQVILTNEEYNSNKDDCSNMQKLLAARLHITIDEIRSLIAAKYQSPDYILTMGDIHTLYRYTTLANLLALSVTDFIIYAQLTGIINENILLLDSIEYLFILKKDMLFTMAEANCIVNQTMTGIDLGFTEDEFVRFISSLKKKIPVENNDENSQFIQSFIVEEMAAFLKIGSNDLNILLQCMLEENELTQWLLDLLTDQESELINKIRLLSKWMVLYQKIYPEILLFAGSDAVSLGINNIQQMTIADIYILSKVNSYVDIFQDKYYKILSFMKNNTDYELLSEITGWDINQLKLVAESISAQKKNTVDLLDNLIKCFDYMKKLNADVTVIERILACQFTNNENDKSLADFLLKDASYETELYIESKKRDALLAYTKFLLKKKYKNLRSNEDVYKYFLIDVQMDEITEISYVKEGINAAQLYLQRCRMGLEQGIRKMNIPDSWWLWLMNYRMWEANRKVFVYPENYLLPSLRQTKTSLFKNVEDSLHQAAITDGYIEEQYTKYLDDYYVLTQLKICASYATVINEENVLFLFARSLAEPYTYYYCKRSGYLAWSEWKNIDVNIDGTNISAVYVYDKLHIFWSSLKKKIRGTVSNDKSNNNTLQADNRTIYTMEVKYTYLNLLEKWTAPQVLIPEEVVYYENSAWGALTNPGQQYIKNTFQMDNECFNKITLLRIGSDSTYDFLNTDKEYERLAVLIGPTIQCFQDEIPLLDKTSPDSDEAAFINKFNHLIQYSNHGRKNFENGYFCTGILKIYNEYLEETNLRHDSEFQMIDSYIPSDGTIMYQMVMDSIHKSAGVNYSPDVIRDGTSGNDAILPFRNNDTKITRPKLTADNFPSKEIFNCLVNAGIIGADQYVVEEMLLGLDLSETLKEVLDEKDANNNSKKLLEVQKILERNVGGLYLFTNIKNAAIIPVDNQPGWFIADCSDEAFLVYPYYIDKNKNEVEVKFTTLDYGLQVCGTRITYVTFTKRDYDTKTAKNIIMYLKDSKLISKSGIADIALCTKDNVSSALNQTALHLTDTQINEIYAVIQNYPYVPSDVFKGVLGTVNEEEEKQILNIFINEGIIFNTSASAAPGYRLDLIKMSEINHVDLKYDETIIRKIYDTLNSLVSSINLNYVGKYDFDVLLKDRKFAVIRLTNGSIKKLKNRFNSGGIKNFLTLETQSEQIPNVLPFDRLAPTENLKKPKALDGVQVDFEGLYREYNWELFYHIVISIAQGFEGSFSYDRAMDWYHYIFNPTKERPETESRYYWNFKPFVDTIYEKLITSLTNPAAVETYNNHPFNPHAIANLRAGAYEKYTVMEYIFNIIQWGDQYFTQNTWEALTSATMMYVLAADLLGPRPREIASRIPELKLTFKNISDAYDNEVPEFIIEYEKFIQKNYIQINAVLDNPDIPYNDIGAYFGVPENDQLIKYWDLVEDRLYKIRNSLDINGNPRVMKLFESPLDVMNILKMMSAPPEGSSGYLGKEVPLYPYRFQYTIEQAKNLTNQLMQLASSMLSAIEKKDAEAMLRLSHTQEQVILDMMSSVKQNQIDEIEQTISALEISKESLQNRKAYYEEQAKEYISDKERTAIEATTAAFSLSTAASVLRTMAGAAHLAPQIGSPFAMTYGGVQLGSSLSEGAAVIEIGASIANFIAQRSGTMAGYDRRRDEWKLQSTLADYEIKNIEKQIEGTKLRKSAAEKDYDIHKKNIQHKKEVIDFVNSKFSNEQLYQWLIGQLSTTMWQLYQMALELSLAAQQAYVYECDKNDNFIRFDYWNSGKKGLFAAEALMLSLNQMQQAYLKKNNRRLEISKNISLVLTCPEAFLKLKAGGSCDFQFPETLFATDYEGGYCRKITSLSITIPAVLAPYETIKATLRQKESKVLLKPDQKGMDYLLGLSSTEPDDGIIRHLKEQNEKIALSHGIEDNGTFQLNFNDERYLPFEGTGVNSSWHLEMPKEANQFDFDSITDVIINIKYTSLEDENLKKYVHGILAGKPVSGGLYYHLKQSFQSAFRQFKESQNKTLRIPMEQFNLSYYHQVSFTNILFKLDLHSLISSKTLLTLTAPGISKMPVAITNNVGSLRLDPIALEKIKGVWSLEFSPEILPIIEKLNDIELIIVYEGRWC